MKIIKESKKEKLSADFIANFISRSWEEVANIKFNISNLKQTFTETKEIESILEELLDAYLISIGQLQQLAEKKDIVVPNKEINLKENLCEKTDAVIAKLILDEKETINEYDKASEELLEDEIFPITNKCLNHIKEEELEHIEELSNIIIQNKEEIDEGKDDFFNSDFEEPELDIAESDFKKWQNQLQHK